MEEQDGTAAVVEVGGVVEEEVEAVGDLVEEAVAAEVTLVVEAPDDNVYL